MKAFRGFLVCLVVILLIALASPVSSFGQAQSVNGLGPKCGGSYCAQADAQVWPLQTSQEGIQSPAGTSTLAPQSGSIQLARLADGSRVLLGWNEESLTLATGALTTDTTNANFLPAGALLLGGSATVSTTITGCTGGWQFGDPTTAGRFSGAADTTLTVGESKTIVNGTGASTGIASATTGIVQGANAKGRITCTTANASAGVVRVNVFYLQVTPPSI